jgi:sugar lactone lactonase YvrE
MSAFQAVAATEAVYDLAEGILWDDRTGIVRWVDISRGRLFSGSLSGAGQPRGSGHAGARIQGIEALDLGQTTGAVALARDGGLLVAAARGLATVSLEGAVSLGPDLLGERTDVRFNDGSVDPQGRFVVGTLSLAAETDEETLLRVSPDGTVEILREGVGLSNGIAYSPDGGTIYHVDTFAGTVAAHSYGRGAFDRQEPWTPQLTDFPASPDGLTVDSTGALWVAQWGGSSVRRYAPTGELLDTVGVDAAQVSCPAFIGPALDILGITTAQEGLTHITDQAGAIFLADVGAAGLPAPRWAGSTSTPYWLSPNVATDARAGRSGL